MSIEFQPPGDPEFMTHNAAQDYAKVFRITVTTIFRLCQSASQDWLKFATTTTALSDIAIILATLVRFMFLSIWVGIRKSAIWLAMFASAYTTSKDDEMDDSTANL